MIPIVPHRRLIVLVTALASGLVLSFSQASPTLAQPAAATAVGPVLTVDASSYNYPISPDIYGMNFGYDSARSGLNLPVNRWGGNATTRYNYQTDVSNLASDWFFENAIPDGGDGTQDGSAANSFIAQNNSAGTNTLLTVPTIGYVATAHHINDPVMIPDSTHPPAGYYFCGFDTRIYGPQTDTDGWFPTCGTGVQSSGGNVTGNDPAETSIVENPVFVQGWVTYLHTKFGTSAPTHFELDNEPDLWYETHRDVHPTGAGYDELYTRGRDYALAIKAADPNAKVFGPVSWGWTGYFYSAADIAARPNDWYAADDPAHQPDKWGTHTGQDFIPWYLSQMKAYDDAHGTRLLDYLDLHYYEQANGVSLSSGANQATRLRTTRSLWDPTYTDESWINQPVYIIPRMRDWVNTYYQGTKLAITEYNWGALDRIDGALAQADVLGIFGRERLDLATLWGPPAAGAPGEYAFRMYLNYDGSGGHFGDTTVQAASADQSKLAVYGSKDTGTGALKLMVINKTAGALSSNLGLTNFTPGQCMSTYTYSSASLHAIVSGWQPVIGSTISYTYPANSITLLVIPSNGASCPASALLAPVPASPKSGAASYAAKTKLVWKAEKGVKSYNVVVQGGAGFSANTKSTSVLAPLGYGRYTWQVQGAAADGLTPFSSLMTFDVTTLVGPKNGLSVRSAKVVFSWKAVKGAAYHLTVWDSTLTPVTDIPWTKTSYKPSPALVPGVYTWTVTVNGQAMPIWSFTVTP